MSLRKWHTLMVTSMENTVPPVTVGLPFMRRPIVLMFMSVVVREGVYSLVCQALLLAL